MQRRVVEPSECWESSLNLAAGVKGDRDQDAQLVLGILGVRRHLADWIAGQDELVDPREAEAGERGRVAPGETVELGYRLDAVVEQRDVPDVRQELNELVQAERLQVLEIGRAHV